MKQTARYIILGVCHGINDCIAGYIIGSLFYRGCTAFESGAYALLYNIVAFGGQLVVARALETAFSVIRLLGGCFLMLAAALACLAVAPALAVLMAGIASAVIHVTGGMEASRADNRAFGIGIFASPGVVGLIGGGFMAFTQTNFILPGILLCAGGLLLLLFYKPYEPAPQVVQRHEPAFERHDVLMCIVLMIISLRSFVWNLVQLAQQGNYSWLLLIGAAAMCGKIAGGYLADSIGHRRYTLWALALSLPFLTLLKKNLAGLCMGVFLLQSTIPATTVMIIQAVRYKPALGIALSFGVSILIAVAFFYTPVIQYISNNTGIFTILLTAACLLLVYGRMAAKQKYK